MAETTVLMGLFEDMEKAVATLDALRALGIPDAQIDLLSSLPYSHKILGRPPVKLRLPTVSVVMAAAGLLTGVFFAVVTPNLYVVRVGGQGVVPGPPTAIVLFELTMLFLIIGTFFGMLFLNNLPDHQLAYYDLPLTDGRIGVVIQCTPEQSEVARALLESEGAEHVHEPERRDI